MTFLIELWMPILLSAVLIFIASSLIHMVLPLHRSDYKKLPREEVILDAVRGTPRGDYVFPHASGMSEMSSDAMKAKYEQGPVGMITIMPTGNPFTGSSLIQWFLYTVLIGVFVAYIAHLGLEAGAAYLTVFQMTGATATAAYAFNHFPNSIWMGKQWSSSFKYVADGLIYGLLTAGSFAWLWPEG